jgi:hypothetical protein
MSAEPIISAGPPSPVTDFEVETIVVDLPRRTTSGKTLAVKLRAVPTVEIIKALDGVPELNRAAGTPDEATFAQAREAIVQSEGPNRKIAALAIMEPPFSFGDAPEAGKAFWGNVHAENQAFIIKTILEFSGFGTPATPAQAQASSFRSVDAVDEPGDGGTGGGRR